jgi:hypothetical protein
MRVIVDPDGAVNRNCAPAGCVDATIALSLVHAEMPPNWVPSGGQVVGADWYAAKSSLRYSQASSAPSIDAWPQLKMSTDPAVALGVPRPSTDGIHRTQTMEMQ